jgi:L-ascorbate metabolism protein UlaG (beta-lactamase superfamily)
VTSRSGARAIALTCAALAAGCFSGPTHRGDKSDHFDGTRFFDDKPAREVGLTGLLKWQANARKRGHWPDKFIDAPPGPAPEREVVGDRMRVTFVNHATTLVQLEGKNILTDPIWSERCSPVSWTGPARIRPPGVRFEDLPRIDVVLISHNHYDHMDVATLERLVDAHHPLILTGLGNDLVLAEYGIEARALDWFDTVTISESLTIHSVPNQHFSNRGLTDGDGTLWTAFVMQGKHAGNAYFAGDTGYGAHFKGVGEKFADQGGVRVAILPIGAYRPEWFMGAVHTTPAEAVKAARDLGARTSVAMHFGTFPLADEGRLDPVRDLYTALGKPENKRVRFWVLGFGEGRDVP